MTNEEVERMDSGENTMLRLHPSNPRYLSWRGKPTVLITSAEHYGAVMNAPFDYIAYLDELHSAELNMTRLFSGVYCEAEGDFNIVNNSLAPGHGDLLCPFARSNTPGYANGGNKFDLTKWDRAYLARLKDFIAQADKRGIIVEYTFFCPYYHDSQWALSPFNPRNNVNAIDYDSGSTRMFRQFGLGNLVHPALLDIQKALVRKIVSELKDMGNLYYEICNEAYDVPAKWQHTIAQTILDAENDSPHKHLIAQNTREVYDPVHPAVSIYNIHPKPVNTCVRDNHHLSKLSALDETGFGGKPRGSDTTAFEYRRWGWTHLLDGGAVYNNLDHSFTVGHPRGSFDESWIWAETMMAVRKQLRILKEFVESHDFIRMRPDNMCIKGGAPEDGAVHILMKRGKEYAIYLYGVTQARPMLDVPAGRYRAKWINTLIGNTDKTEDVTHDGGVLALCSPEYKVDVALSLKAMKQ